MSMHETGPTGEPRRTRWLAVPPPLLFVVSFFAAVALDRLARLPLVPATAETAARAVGVGLLALAALLPATAAALFLRHRTTLIPHGTARALVTGGPYRVTRNPMYLGVTIAYVGVALVTNLAWALPLLAVPVWVLNSRIIPAEEASLARSFGAAYGAYRARVRRWI